MLSKQKRILWVCLLCIVVTITCLGCSSERKTEGTEGNPQEETGQTQTTWSIDSDCSACHEAETTVDSGHLAVVHEDLGLKCIDCHDSESMISIHDGGADAQPIKYTNELCFGCHVENNHSSWDKVITGTADSTAVKNISGEVVNPHAPHPSDSTAGELDCKTCHSMHSAEKLVQGCYSCHHSMTLQNCSECHED